jgi:hypothetical protein
MKIKLLEPYLKIWLFSASYLDVFSSASVAEVGVDSSEIVVFLRASYIVILVGDLEGDIIAVASVEDILVGASVENIVVCISVVDNRWFFEALSPSVVDVVPGVTVENV